MRKPSIRTIRTAKKREDFLTALAETANVTRSCKKAKITRSNLYLWRDADEDFEKEWDAALEKGTDYLEDEAVRRAAEGTLKPIFQGGKKVGTIREYSDTLLIFMLKARRPDKFKERSATEHTGGNGGPIKYHNVTDEKLAEAIKSVRDKF